tara:strand:- start:209 stop:373 length:165 start_codon:yes stop_codon:yes gene_type:complete
MLLATSPTGALDQYDSAVDSHTWPPTPSSSLRSGGWSSLIGEFFAVSMLGGAEV